MNDEDVDLRCTRIWATRQALIPHGVVAEVAESEPVLCIPGPQTLSIRCAPRASDGGALWLYADDDSKAPIALADEAHIHEVVTWVKGALAARAIR